MSTSRVSAVTGPITVLTVVALVAGAVIAFTGWQPFEDDKEGRKAAKTTRVDLSELKLASTKASLPKAASDRGNGATDGEVVHPLEMIPVYAAPGRKPFAKVGRKQLGELWLPVVGRKGGWTKVLLPSRPNSSAGWVRTRDVERRTTPYEVRVHLGSRTVEVLQDGSEVGTWTVAIGAAGTPTPTGRTFVLGLIQDPNQSFSEFIIPLGTHSDTLDSYGGGPGTVAFHGWPDEAVFGQAISHGCIRVPDEGMDVLRQVPLGTVVEVDDA